MKIRALDLFSGIGGFHLGFSRAGYEVTSYFSEVDKHAIAVYQHQFKNSTYVGAVGDVRGADLPAIDLITFGSPCQDFSQAGARRGLEGDRSSLIAEAIRLIRECRPRVFIWENVKGTFSSNDGADFAAILQAFIDLGGYRLEWQLLNTSWFLPQNRERVYLVGHLATSPGDWGGVFPITEESRKTYDLQRQQAYTNTILRVYGNDAQGSYVGERQLPSQDYRLRRLTAIECERLQGFPDNHTEFGLYEDGIKRISIGQRYSQCGNAVSVDVVKEIALRLKPIMYG